MTFIPSEGDMCGECGFENLIANIQGILCKAAEKNTEDPYKSEDGKLNTRTSFLFLSL